MPEKCSVFGCTSRCTNVSKSEIKLYRFPRDENLLGKWKGVLRFRGNSSRDRICQLHFDDSDFLLTNLGWKVLVQGAVPSRNLPPSTVSHYSKETGDIIVNIDTSCSPSFNEDHPEEDLDNSDGRLFIDHSNSPKLSTLPDFQTTASHLQSEELSDASVRDSELFRKRRKLYDEASHQKSLKLCSGSVVDVSQRKDTSQIPAIPQNGILSCQFCDGKFPDRLLLLLHLASHNTSLQNPLSLPSGLEHLMHTLPNGCLFLCFLCGVTFDRRRKLHLHRQRCHPVYPYCLECFKCDAIYEKKEWKELKSHVKNKHLQGKFCTTCDRMFSTAIQLWLHSDRHGQEGECPECGLQFQDISVLVTHLKSHKFVPYFSCDFCSIVFGSRKSVESHLKTHNVEEHAPVECLLCMHFTSVLQGRHFHQHKFLRSVKMSVAEFDIASSRNEDHKESILNADEEIQTLSSHSLPIVKVEPMCVSDNIHSDVSGPSTSCLPREISSTVESAKVNSCPSSSEIPRLFHSVIFNKKSSEGESNHILVKYEDIASYRRIVAEFCCEDCGKSFGNENEMAVHQKLHRSRGDFTCIDCGEVCQSSKALTIHYEEHVKMEGTEVWSDDEN